MIQRATNSKITTIGAFLSAAVVGGVGAAAALGSAPTAKADCASFFGIGNSAHCQSNPTSFAIAIGPNATAIATGLFGAAFAIGEAPVSQTPGNTGVATAVSTGVFTFANAAGDDVKAVAGGIYGIAMQWGYDGKTLTQGFANIAQGWTNPFGSAAGDFDTTLASGIFNDVLNAAMVDGSGYSGKAIGIGNYAVNGWGDDANVTAGGTSTSFGNIAVNIFGGGNVVAGPGPLAIAGAVGQLAGQTTAQYGPGIHITNGGTPVFGGSAASTRAAAAALHTTRSTAHSAPKIHAAHAAASSHSNK
jgi:hypothetical protein